MTSAGERRDGTEILDALRDPKIVDPLSEVTRKERRTLLAATLVAAALSKGGLIPTDINAFGITVTSNERTNLLFLLAILLIYLIAAFALYAAADLRRRKALMASDFKPAADLAASIAIPKFDTDREVNTEELVTDPNFNQLSTFSSHAQLANRVLQIATVRTVIDVHFPIVAGIVAVILVLLETTGSPGWTPLLVTSGAVLLLYFGTSAYWQRKKLLASLRKARRNWHMSRVKALNKKLQSAGEGSKKRERLQRLAVRHLEKVIHSRWA